MEEGRRCVRLDDNSFVVSAGGWKQRQNEAISRDEYTRRVTGAFGIDAGRARDSYNMVELNSVLNECEFHEKHVVPWVDVQARDARTNQVIEDGELGCLAFYDGSALSYPCFVLAEDYGFVYSDKCRCGRIGKRVKVVRRLEGIESRGCALKMARDRSGPQDWEQGERYFKSYFRRRDLYERRGKSNGNGG
jgi:long-chain-fatty-acid---luciferin-component ligase